MLFIFSVKKKKTSQLSKHLPWFFDHVHISVHDTEDEVDSAAPDLLITAPASVQKDTLQMYFEQFTEQFELAKHGNNSWILKLCSQAGMVYEGLWNVTVWGETNRFCKSISVHHLYMTQATSLDNSLSTEKQTMMKSTLKGSYEVSKRTLFDVMQCVYAV